MSIISPAATALLLVLARPGWAATHHTVVPKDTLWDLAARYYKDPYKWHKIADANPPPNVLNPHWIYPGQTIEIPDVEEPEAPAEPEPEPEQAAKPPEPPQIEAAEPEPEVEVAAEPEPAAEPQPLLPQPEESLSRNMPASITSLWPSMPRVKIDERWKPDGKIIEAEGDKIIAASGDYLRVELKGKNPQQGERYYVFRPSSATETEPEEAVYLAEVGLVEIRRDAGDHQYRVRVVRAHDGVQPGDFLAKEKPSGI